MSRLPLPRTTEARFLFPGDVIALYPGAPHSEPVVILVESIRFSHDDVLVEGLDQLGREESAHLYVWSEVHVRTFAPRLALEV